MRTIKQRLLPKVGGGVFGYFFEHPHAPVSRVQPAPGSIRPVVPGSNSIHGGLFAVDDLLSAQDRRAMGDMGNFVPTFGDGLVEPGEAHETLEYDPLGPISHSTEPEFIEEAVAKVESDGDGPDESGSSSWLQDWIDDWRADLRGRPWFRILCEAKLMIDQRRARKAERNAPPQAPPVVPPMPAGSRRDNFAAPDMNDFAAPAFMPFDADNELTRAVQGVTSAMRSLEHAVTMSRLYPRQDQMTVHVPQPVWLPPAAPTQPPVAPPQAPSGHPNSGGSITLTSGMGGCASITGGAGGSTSGMPGGVQLHGGRTLKDAVLDGMGDFTPPAVGDFTPPAVGDFTPPTDAGGPEEPLVEPASDSIAIGSSAAVSPPDCIAIGSEAIAAPSRQPDAPTPGPVDEDRLRLVREEVESTISKLGAALESLKKLN